MNYLTVYYKVVKSTSSSSSNKRPYISLLIILQNVFLGEVVAFCLFWTFPTWIYSTFTSLKGSGCLICYHISSDWQPCDSLGLDPWIPCADLQLWREDGGNHTVHLLTRRCFVFLLRGFRHVLGSTEARHTSVLLMFLWTVFVYVYQCWSNTEGHTW